MVLHVICSHYTYAEMPFGWEIGSWFRSDRNMYDLALHFSYGFLLAYPVREIFMRVVKVKDFWSYYLPVDITAAASALYEIVEWLVAIKVSPEEGLVTWKSGRYLGCTKRYGTCDCWCNYRHSYRCSHKFEI